MSFSENKCNFEKTEQTLTPINGKGTGTPLINATGKIHMEEK